MLKQIFSLLCLVVLVNCQCPNVPALQNFVPTDYLGVWYEQQRFPFIVEDNLKCIKDTYTVRDPVNLVVNVTISGIVPSTGQLDTISAVANVQNPAELSKLTLSFTFAGFYVEYGYWIIDTDYTNYALVYSCQVQLGQVAEYAFVYSRPRFLSPTIITNLENKLKGYGVNTAKFLKTDQTNCTN